MANERLCCDVAPRGQLEYPTEAMTRRNQLWSRSLCFLSVALFATAVAVRASAHTTPQKQPNILLVVVDTLRADRLEAYGSHKGLTPFVDSLAERGNVFLHAYAQSSWTLPSVASLFTSRYPSQHGVTSFDSILPDVETTLAEALRQRGYATGGFAANDLISAANGYAQGFDEFGVFSWGKERADRVNRESLSWLSSLPPARPVFLYLQYMEPHPPYRPPAKMLRTIERRRGRSASLSVQPSDAIILNSRQWARADPQALTRLEDLYDAEVMSLDAALRDLFSALQSRSFLDNAVVIVTADHGEELMDHGHVGHGVTLYDEVIHVPLIVALPHQRRGTRQEHVVSLVDVAPTLLDLVGVSPPPSFEGHVLSEARDRGDSRAELSAPPLGLQASRGDGVAYSELIDAASEKMGRKHDRAVVVGQRKLIVGVTGENQHYDLQKDPRETNPNGLRSLDQLSMRQTVDRLSTRRARQETRPSAHHLDEAVRDRTRVLGYGE